MTTRRAQSLGYIGAYPDISYFGIVVTYLVFSFFREGECVCTIHSAFAGRIHSSKKDRYQFPEWKGKVGFDKKYINTIPILAVWTIYKTNNQ